MCLLWWKGLHGSDIQFKFVLFCREGIQSVVFFDEWSVDLTRPYSSIAAHDLQFSAMCFFCFAGFIFCHMSPSKKRHLLTYISKQKEAPPNLLFQLILRYLQCWQILSFYYSLSKCYRHIWLSSYDRFFFCSVLIVVQGIAW